MHQSMSYLNSSVQKLEKFKVLVIEDPKPTQQPNVKVVNILRTNMYFLCKILR